MKNIINKPDTLVIYDIYFKINVKAFIECFINITHDEMYFRSVYYSLLKIAAAYYDIASKESIKEKLTVGAMIKMADYILRKGDCGLNEETAMFIIEKLFIEPLVILGKELQNNQITKGTVL